MTVRIPGWDHSGIPDPPLSIEEQRKNTREINALLKRHKIESRRLAAYIKRNFGERK